MDGLIDQGSGYFWADDYVIHTVVPALGVGGVQVVCGACLVFGSEQGASSCGHLQWFLLLLLLRFLLKGSIRFWCEGVLTGSREVR